MKRYKKSTSPEASAIGEVPVDQLRKVIGGYASPTRATPPSPEIAVIIICAVA